MYNVKYIKKKELGDIQMSEKITSFNEANINTRPKIMAKPMGKDNRKNARKRRYNNF